MKKNITKDGVFFRAHDVDGNIRNEAQHSAFAFLVCATIACDGAMVRIWGKMLNTTYLLAELTDMANGKAVELCDFINDLAYGETQEKPVYRITAAHCLALVCKENKYHSQWQLDKVEAGKQVTATTLTLDELLSLIC